MRGYSLYDNVESMMSSTNVVAPWMGQAEKILQNSKMLATFQTTSHLVNRDFFPIYTERYDVNPQSRYITYKGCDNVARRAGVMRR